MLNLNRYDIIKKFSSILNKYNINFYLVGGALRDILLFKEPVDFDFSAEVDENTHKLISECIASEMQCRYTYNSYYHTCKFIIDGYDVDFIMSRKEFYKFCGCIPEIYASNIIDDLKRRDYAINSIALSLDTNNFGTLVDPSGGINDLNTKLLRVLHDKSFFDDPSRIFRGIKYASRLGFNFDGHTEGIINKSISEGCLSGLKYGRIKQETDILLSEENSLASVDYLKKYMIFNYLSAREIVIKSYKNQLKFSELDMNEKYAVLLYNNTPDILSELKNLFGMSAAWLMEINNLKTLESLSDKGDRELYNFLFKNCKKLNDSVLQLLFPEDCRIKNYIKYKNVIDTDMAVLLNMKEKDRNEYILNKKIDFIVKL